MSEMSVRFRYTGIQHPSGEISAVILDCATRLEAIKMFSSLHGYIMAPTGSKTMRLSFARRTDSTGDMSLAVQDAEETMEVAIRGIEWPYVEKLRASLQVFSYYLILAGFSEKGEFHLLPPKDYHFLKADIFVDAQWVKGAPPNGSVDWTKLIEEL